MSGQLPSVQCGTCQELWCDVSDECKELSDNGDSESPYKRWLEAYKSLTFWNKHDNDAVLVFDRIFIPVSVGLPALTKVLPIATNNESATATHIIATVASLALITFWFLLSLRYRQSIDLRYKIMQKIECKLHFCAHRYYLNLQENRREGRKWWRLWPLRPWYWPRDQDLRKIFYLLVMVLLVGYLVILIFFPGVLE